MGANTDCHGCYAWQADRDGQAGKFAEMYNASQLRDDNDNKSYVVAEREGRPQRSSVATMSELAVTQETVNTIWWGYYILLKVSQPCHCPHTEWSGPEGE